MKKMSKILALLLTLAMVCGMFAACGGGSAPAATEAPKATEAQAAAPATTEAPAEPAPADDNTLPRNETLYFAGQQWGPVNSWNIVGTNQNNSMAIAGNAGGYRSLMFETLFMFDFMSGEKKGLLADSYEWNDDLTEMTVTLKDAAKWSDGTPVTAADVAATWDVGVLTNNNTGGSFKAYIEAIEATGDKTLVIKSKLNDAGKPVNPLKV